MKFILFFLLTPFVLISCSRNNQQEWEFDRAVALDSAHASERLSLPAINSFQGLELELVRGITSTRMYLNAFSLPFPCDLEGKSEVSLFIEEQEYLFKAECFQGRQRLLLPQEITALIITALMNDSSIQISVGRYQATIISTRFAEFYRYFEAPGSPLRSF